MQRKIVSIPFLLQLENIERQLSEHKNDRKAPKFSDKSFLQTLEHYANPPNAHRDTKDIKRYINVTHHGRKQFNNGTMGSSGRRIFRRRHVGGANGYNNGNHLDHSGYGTNMKHYFGENINSNKTGVSQTAIENDSADNVGMRRRGMVDRSDSVMADQLKDVYPQMYLNTQNKFKYGYESPTLIDSSNIDCSFAPQTPSTSVGNPAENLPFSSPNDINIPSNVSPTPYGSTFEPNSTGSLSLFLPLQSGNINNDAFNGSPVRLATFQQRHLGQYASSITSDNELPKSSFLKDENVTFPTHLERGSETSMSTAFQKSLVNGLSDFPPLKFSSMRDSPRDPRNADNNTGYAGGISGTSKGLFLSEQNSDPPNVVPFIPSPTSSSIPCVEGPRGNGLLGANSGGNSCGNINLLGIWSNDTDIWN